MSSERYRIFLVPDASGALVPTRGFARRRPPSVPPADRLLDKLAALGALMAALKRMGRRGPGPAAWVPVLDDPLTFLLDGMSDALVVRGMDGQVLFANSLARELQLTERRFSTYEEFEQGGDFFQERGLQMDVPEGQLTFTLVSRVRR